MPNWTALRWKFKRSKRLQLLAFLALLAILYVLNSIIAAALRPDAPPATVAGPPVVVDRVNVTLPVPVWRVGDYWVWEDGHGMRITDRVVELSRASSNVTLYKVRRESSLSDGLVAHGLGRVETVTYDSRFLAVRSVEYPTLTVAWEQRTVGLVDITRSQGFPANASLDHARKEDGRFLRVANITQVSKANVEVPAGRFTNATYVQGEFLDYDLRDPDKSQVLVWAHWFHSKVGNDVAFILPNSTAQQPIVMKLVGYRSTGGSVPPPPQRTVPTWRIGFTWTYEGEEGLTWTTKVVAAKDGVVTVEDTRDQAGTKVTDVRRFRTSDMRNVNYTLFGARFDMSPIGHPLVPPDGEHVHRYVKTVTAARGPIDFHGNATITSKGGAVLAVPAGTFDVRRVDVKEVERDAQGRANVVEQLRYYAAEIGNDVQFTDFEQKTWSLRSVSFGPAPFRFDTLPPPV